MSWAPRVVFWVILDRTIWSIVTPTVSVSAFLNWRDRSVLRIVDFLEVSIPRASVVRTLGDTPYCFWSNVVRVGIGIEIDPPDSPHGPPDPPDTTGDCTTTEMGVPTANSEKWSVVNIQRPPDTTQVPIWAHGVAELGNRYIGSTDPLFPVTCMEMVASPPESAREAVSLPII
jgi:hypothetical protein